MAEAIGLYGGSFNPIHNGHLIVVRAVAERLGLARVVFLPSAQPPHKEAERLAPADHRSEMVKLAIAGESTFAFSDLDLTRPGPSYTIDTVRRYRSSLGREVDLCWIIGADSLVELPSWRQAERLVDEFRIITAVRPGWSGVNWAKSAGALSAEQTAKLRAAVLETPMIDISSTDIRRRVSEGRSIRYLVPDSVRNYIATHGLYVEPDEE